MSNSKVYSLDPNVFLVTAQAGAAQSPADRSAAAWAKILARANGAGGTGYEVVDTTATSLAVDVFESRLTISGTMTATLPDGTYVGQRKLVRAITAASTPKLTLTVTTPETEAGSVCSSTFIFDTVGQAVEFEWTKNSKWRAVRVQRAGGTADNVVVGTTVLTGYNLWLTYGLSVTGTVSSTSTMALPNGSAVGERCQIINTTAASSPIGSIGGTFKGGLAAAYTLIGTIGVVASTTVTGDMALLEWDGTAWWVLYQSGCTLS